MSDLEERNDDVRDKNTQCGVERFLQLCSLTDFFWTSLLLINKYKRSIDCNGPIFGWRCNKTKNLLSFWNHLNSSTSAVCLFSSKNGLRLALKKFWPTKPRKPRFSYKMANSLCCPSRSCRKSWKLQQMSLQY